MGFNFLLGIPGKLTKIMGSGFSTTTDSLKVLSDNIDTINGRVTAAVATATALATVDNNVDTSVSRVTAAVATATALATVDGIVDVLREYKSQDAMQVTGSVVGGSTDTVLTVASGRGRLVSVYVGGAAAVNGSYINVTTDGGTERTIQVDDVMITDGSGYAFALILNTEFDTSLTVKIHSPSGSTTEYAVHYALNK